MIKLKDTINRYNMTVLKGTYTCKFENGGRLYFDISIGDWRGIEHLVASN